MSTDDERTGQIETAPLSDYRVSGQRIHMPVVEGAATPRGSVPSYRRKLTSQEIAALFRGCRG